MSLGCAASVFNGPPDPVRQIGVPLRHQVVIHYRFSWLTCAALPPALARRANERWQTGESVRRCWICSLGRGWQVLRGEQWLDSLIRRAQLDFSGCPPETRPACLSAQPDVPPLTGAWFIIQLTDLMGSSHLWLTMRWYDLKDELLMNFCKLLHSFKGK